jgi:putative chitinase
MAYQVTLEQMMQFATSVDKALIIQLTDSINETANRFQVDQSPRRIRYFVSQAFYETEGFTFWSENLNYTTAERLCEVWPSHFTMDMPAVLGGVLGQVKGYAPDYVKNPQKLANFVYANRNGNGDLASGDGWAFRGRGGFHLTGRGNYAAYDSDVYGDGHIVAAPDLVAQPKDAMLSAGWFWNKNQLNAQADLDAFTETTHRINGATGQQLTTLVQQRLVVLNKANKIFVW